MLQTDPCRPAPPVGQLTWSRLIARSVVDVLVVSPQLTEGHLSRRVEPHQGTEARTQTASSRRPLTASYAAGLVGLREPVGKGAGRTRRSMPCRGESRSEDNKHAMQICRKRSACKDDLDLPRSMSVSVNRGQTGRDVWCMHAPITHIHCRPW